MPHTSLATRQAASETLSAPGVPATSEFYLLAEARSCAIGTIMTYSVHAQDGEADGEADHEVGGEEVLLLTW